MITLTSRAEKLELKSEAMKLANFGGDEASAKIFIFFVELEPSKFLLAQAPQNIFFYIGKSINYLIKIKLNN